MTARRSTPHTNRVNPDRVIAAVAGVAESWMRGEWPGQPELISRIAGTSGFSLEVVQAGLAAHFGVMSAQELRRWLGPTSGPPSGGGRVAVLPASNIPGVGLLPTMAALLVGARVLLKTSIAEPHLMPAWRDRLATFDTDLGELVEVEEWVGGEDPREARLLADIDRIVVLGADSTIEDLSSRYGGRPGGAGSGKRILGLGTGASVAVVGGGSDLAGAARRLARDVAIWDQQGCLSPQGIAVIGTARDRLDLMEQLAIALAATEVELPAGRLSVPEAARLRGFRAELLARRVAGEALEWREAPPTGGTGVARWLVWADEETRFEPAPARRHVLVRSAPSIEAFVARGLPSPEHRQAVGLEESDPDRLKYAEALRAAGVPYIAALGSMQAPSVDWPNKGHDLLAELKGINR